jgi:hypothetical protein
LRAIAAEIGISRAALDEAVEQRQSAGFWTWVRASVIRHSAGRRREVLITLALGVALGAVDRVLWGSTAPGLHWNTPLTISCLSALCLVVAWRWRFERLLFVLATASTWIGFGVAWLAIHGTFWDDIAAIAGIGAMGFVLLHATMRAAARSLRKTRPTAI